MTLEKDIAPTQRVGKGKHPKYPPYAFTEQGVAMLSSVLRSKRAVKVNIEIMRAFVKLRKLIESHGELANKLDELEKKYDGHFKATMPRVVVLSAAKDLCAIRQLMKAKKKNKNPIGFKNQN